MTETTYLVATHSNLVRATLDDRLRLADAEIVNTGYHYGIALLDAPAGSGAELIVFRGGTTVHEQTCKEFHRYRYRDQRLELVDQRPLQGRVDAVHQIAFANAGVYLINTEYNSICFYGLDGEKRDEYHFGDVEHNLNHINSVFPAGNQLWVVFHNGRRKESELAVLTHDPQSGFRLEAMISLWHLMCHNVFVTERELIYCASSARSFVSVDLASQRIRQTVRFKGHTKGLSVAGDRIVLGKSDYAARGERSTSDSHLVVIDRSSLTLQREILLRVPGRGQGLGNINEVRAIGPTPEEAHAAPVPVAIEPSALRFARRSPLEYALLSLRIGCSKPIWRAKGSLFRIMQRATA